MQNQIESLPDTDIDFGDSELKTLPYPEHSKAATKRSGRVLSQIIHGDEITGEIITAFKVAHSWRISHVYPMRIEHRLLTNMAKEFGGSVTAARLKRMASIRKKLYRSPVSLERIQDLGGNRVVLPDVDAVYQFQAKFEKAHIARKKRETDYLKSPKPGGYRCLHLIVKPNCKGDRSVHNNQTLEIQIRTHLQHIWATAGEAIGAMRGEDIKAGEGSADWLRLLELMGAELALLDGLQVGEHVQQDRRARLRELARLELKLAAIDTLTTYTTAVDFQKNRGWESARFFLVVLDTISGTVRVRPQSSFISEPYDGQGDPSEKIQTALVSVSDANALALAYPNFFLDVKEFLQHLKDVLGYTDAKPKYDLSFLEGWNS